MIRLLSLNALLLLFLTGLVGAEQVQGPADVSQADGLYKLKIPAGWGTLPPGKPSDMALRKTGTGLQPRLSINLERGGYTPTKDSMKKDFEQFEKMFSTHKFKLVSIKPVKVGKMKGYRLIGTEKSDKVFNTHVMQKLAVPGGKVLDAHGRAEASSSAASSKGSQEIVKILDSMKP